MSRSKMSSPLLEVEPEETGPPPVFQPDADMVELEIDGEMKRVDIQYEFQLIDTDKAASATNVNAPAIEVNVSAVGASAPASEPKMDGDGELPCSSRPLLGAARRSNKMLEMNSKKEEDDEGSLLAKGEPETKSQFPVAAFRIKDDYHIDDAPPRRNHAYIRFIERNPDELSEVVEYDLDDMDLSWLDVINGERKKELLQPVSADVLELILDKLEKESYLQMQSSGKEHGPVIDHDAPCCICMDVECENSNAILFCDMCNVAVHQECYGVPLIPEAQWLCRRCYLNPLLTVDCVLCPNKGGAFKQTKCDRWAHSICAIWIPEVSFSNPVFQEPIEDVEKIPPNRWKLCCSICKQKGVGACIQCYKTNCYTAFHVTCAQKAGLYMRLKPVASSDESESEKAIYCNVHAPPAFLAERDNGSQTSSQKQQQITKMIAEQSCAPPVVSAPTITPEQLSTISTAVKISKRKEFIRKAVAYWTLKRQSRNGTPLLRRLQIASSAASTSFKGSVSQDELKSMILLRQQLEKTRLLLELTKKREELKCNLVDLKSKEYDLNMQPFNYFLASIVDEIISRDTQQIFTQPVDPAHVPDYLDIIKNPMDLSTMRKKIFEFEYEAIDDLQKDFQLMIDNCFLYNPPNTVFYRSALNMQEFGGIAFREAKRKNEVLGFHPSGMMNEVPPPEYHAKPTEVDEDCLEAEIANIMEDTSRFDLDVDGHIGLLEETIDKSLNLRDQLCRKKMFFRIKNELAKLRKRKRLAELEGGSDCSGSGGGVIVNVAEEKPTWTSSPLKQDGETVRRILRYTDKEVQNQQSRPSRRSLPSSEMRPGSSSAASDSASTSNSNVLAPRNAPTSTSSVSKHSRRRPPSPPKAVSTGRIDGRPVRATQGAKPALVLRRQSKKPGSQDCSSDDEKDENDEEGGWVETGADSDYSENLSTTDVDSSTSSNST